MPFKNVEKRKEYVKKHAQDNPKMYKDAILKYQGSEKYKETRKKYYKSEKYKEMTRRGHLRRKYGISLETFHILNESQNGLCKICAKPPGIKGLAVDHNHSTGKVRGLLCYKCNASLGYLHEDISIIESMIKYIKYYG